MRINSCINFTSKLKENRPHYQPPEKTPLKGYSIDEKIEESLYLLSTQNRTMVYSTNGLVNRRNIENLNIPNCHIYKNSIVRGESLSSRKNRKFLSPLKKNGITSVIDLRDKYKSLSYEELCKQKGLKYYHFPVDASGVADKTIIKNMPQMFEVLDNEKTYISCAQGLHRTDIALAIYYMFSPKQLEVPIMYGHIREEGFKYADIIRRINSIKRNLTDENLKTIGWELENFEKEFLKKKKLFIMFNKLLANN